MLKSGHLYTEMVADLDNLRVSEEKEYDIIDFLKQKARIMRESGF